MIHWDEELGAPLCVMKCMRLSGCEIDGEPHCIECADDVIERMALMEVHPELANVLPSLGYGAPRQLRPMSPLPKNISGESEELRAGRKAWLDYAKQHGLPVEGVGRADRQPAPAVPDREPSSTAHRGSRTPGGNAAQQPSAKPPVSQLSLLEEE